MHHKLDLLVVALQRCGLVSAASLAFLGAVVLAVLVGQLLVEGVAAGNLRAFLLKLDLSGVRDRQCLVVLLEHVSGVGRGDSVLILVPDTVRPTR
jgi:hypothetical protein